MMNEDQPLKVEAPAVASQGTAFVTNGTLLTEKQAKARMLISFFPTMNGII